MNTKKIYYHLPGLFEFYELYKVFIPLFFTHREWFYEWCEIGSVYGAPADCLWGGGRVGFGDDNVDEVIELMNKYNISSRLTFSNSLITKDHLYDRKCNNLCRKFNKVNNGVIVHSDILLDYLRSNYSNLYYVSSTTKVITGKKELKEELNRNEFRFVVPDFRFNKNIDYLMTLTENQKTKVELLCNECCRIGCKDRKKCYESVSRKSLGENDNFYCTAYGNKAGYSFSKAMKNPAFIGIKDILNIYMPMGIEHFKIEGRGLGSAIVLEFLLYYMTKPEYQINVREEVYLDNMLDLF